MADNANPYGMNRPFDRDRLARHRGYTEPKGVTRRHINQRKNYAVSEGNDPYGMPRPNTPYDQDMEPDD